MNISFQTIVAAGLLASLSACSPDAEAPVEGDRPSDPGTPLATVDDPGPTNPDGYLVEDPANAGSNEIPPAMRGRWGLVAADCEPGRADAKGLLEIDGTTLTFYESVGTLDEVTTRDPGNIRAEFDFTGEGMTWQRDMALQLQGGGGTLVRQEYGAEAAADPFTYRKCN